MIQTRCKYLLGVVLLVLFAMLCLPFTVYASGIGNYGDACDSDSDCDSIFEGNCCLDAAFCGDMLNKCVFCDSDEECWETPGAPMEIDGDGYTTGYYCNDGICRHNCRFIEDCGIDTHSIACDNDYCYQCYENSDCAWKANDYTDGVCLNHQCVDCISDDDCVVPPRYEPVEHPCQRNHCEIGWIEDGDYSEEDVSDGGDADGDSENESTESADGDSEEATPEENDDDASCSSAGGINMLALLMLLPLALLRRRIN